MGEKDGYYVGICTHIDESREVDVCSELRDVRFKEMFDKRIEDQYRAGHIHEWIRDILGI